MWCLGTIIAVNEAAAKRARNGESERLAYKDVGIGVYIKNKKPEPKLKVKVA